MKKCVLIITICLFAIKLIFAQDTLTYQLVNDIFVINHITKECRLNLIIHEIQLTEVNFIDKPIGVFSYHKRITKREIRKGLKQHFSHNNTCFLIKQLKTQKFELWDKKKIIIISEQIVKLNKKAPLLKLSKPLFSISQQEAIITIYYGLYNVDIVTLLCKKNKGKWFVVDKIMNVVYH
jgi:hypothetical protein